MSSVAYHHLIDILNSNDILFIFSSFVVSNCHFQPVCKLQLLFHLFTKTETAKV